MKRNFSVIIPTLNEERYLQKLLQDLTKQQDKNFEVVIVDGYSEDNTQGVAQDFEDKLVIKVIFSKKRNPAVQRNLGSSVAVADYLIFLDADMRIGKLFISKIRKEVESHHYLLYLPLHLPSSTVYHDEIISKVTSFFVEVSHLTDRPFTYGPCMIFWKKFFHFLGGFDDRVFLFEDHHIVQKARKHGVHAKLLPEVSVKFSWRRYEKEGRLNVLGKYFIASTQFITKGRVDKKLFEYEMGGKAKYLSEVKKSWHIDEFIVRKLKEFHTLIRE